MMSPGPGDLRVTRSSHVVAEWHIICIQNLHRSLILLGWSLLMHEDASRGREIERKFLIPTKPDFLKDCPRKRIRQGYLAVGGNRTEVRVRQEGKQYLLTLKSGKGQTRVEEELRIGRKRFDSLWPLTRGQRVRKVRYFASHHDRTIQVDVYRRKLKGLVVAEVEFPDTAQARAFEPPEWLGREVTDDERFRNQSLAANGLPEEAADAAPATHPSGH
jgi:CYTH domain-containing protein